MTRDQILGMESDLKSYINRRCPKPQQVKSVECSNVGVHFY
jgi:hypothetical protein